MKQRNVYDVGGKYFLVIKLTVFIALARAWEGGCLVFRNLGIKIISCFSDREVRNNRDSSFAVSRISLIS